MLNDLSAFFIYLVKLKIYIDRVLIVVIVYGRLVETPVCRSYFMFTVVLVGTLCRAAVQF